MPETVRVEVTADDIRRGERAHCFRCPVALAVKRALPDALRHLEVEVGTDIVSLMGDHGLPADVYYADLPLAAQGFIVEFDGEGGSEAFGFDLDFQEL